MSDSETREQLRAHRRAMLKAAAGCGMMTQTSLMATLLNLQATKAMAAANNDLSGYKALVCLFLLGGNDSYNMLVPRDGTSTTGEYGDYHTARGGFENGNNNPGGLALEQSSLLPIVGPGGRGFGVHEGMPEVQSLYNNNKLAFVSNVGSLNRPITRAEYNSNSTGARPIGLFSHADHQRHWMTGLPDSLSHLTGWGGKMADLLASTNGNDTISMNISTNGVNLFQAGDSVVPYSVGTNGATVVNDYSADLANETNFRRRLFTKNMDSLLGQTYSNLLSDSLADVHRNSTDAAIEFNDAINAVNLNTSFDDEYLSNRMKVIARVIGAQSTLEQSRQVFFVAIGGWDNHANLITAQESNLPKVSKAIKSFNDAMVELNVDNDVTLFTASDFARTLGTNGQGSDHAWASNQMVCGGSVKGGQIYGDFPTSLLNPTDSFVGDLNLGRGRMIPTTSVDQMSAELAMWFGIGNNQDLVTILPQIREFYLESETDSPLQMFN